MWERARNLLLAKYSSQLERMLIKLLGALFFFGKKRWLIGLGEARGLFVGAPWDLSILFLICIITIKYENLNPTTNGAETFGLIVQDSPPVLGMIWVELQ